MIIGDADVLVRWTHDSFSITGWGWFVVLFVVFSPWRGSK